MSIKSYDVLLSGSTFQHIGAPFNYSRGSAGPLDNTTVWTSLLSAEAYARGDFTGEGAKAAGFLSSDGNFIPYVGQILTVKENDTYVTYVIENEAGHLKKVGDTESLNPTISALSDAIDENAANISALSDAFEDFSEISLSGIDAVKDQLNEALSVTVEKQETAEEGFLNTYVIKQGGNQVGAKINIPKDFLVKSADLCTDVDGKYIDFVVNSISGDANESHIRLDVDDLVDVYTAVDSETIDLTITDKNEVSAFVKDGSLTWSKMSSDVTEWKAVVEGNIEKLADDQSVISGDLSELSGKVEGLSNEVSVISGDLDKAIKDEATARGEAIAGLTQTVSSISGDLNTAIETEVTARGEAITNLSGELKGDIAAAKDAAILSAKDYTNEQIAALDFTDTLSSLSGEIVKVADEKVEALSGSLSGTVDTKVSELRTEVSSISSDIVGQIADAKSEALSSAKEYTDQKIADLSVESIYATKAELSDAKSEAITSAETYTNEQIAALSITDYAKVSALNEVSERVSTLETGTSALSGRMTAAEGQLSQVDGKIDTAKSEAISSAKDYTDEKISSLGDVFNFKGIKNSIEELEAITDAKTGDVYLVGTKEFVYTAENSWVEFGDGSDHATKTELEKEIQDRKAADDYLSSVIDNKVFIDGKSITSLSVENISQEDYHDLVTQNQIDPNKVYIVSAETYNMYDQKIINLKAGTEEKDAVNFGQISALSGTIMTEVEANKLSSITLGDTVFTPENNNFTLSISSICGGGAKDFD